MEEQYGFTIIDAPVKVSETTNIIAYNILVKSDNITSETYFENLVVNINKANDSIKAFIIKYSLETPITNSADNSFAFETTRTITPILYNANTSTTAKENPCVRLYYATCYNDGAGAYDANGGHTPGEGCTNESLMEFYYVDYCSSGGGGGDGIDYSSGGPPTNTTTGNESGGGGSGYSIYDNPTPPCASCPELEEDGTVDDPCWNLKNGTASANYKQKFKDLNKEEKFNLNKESGFGQVGDSYIDGTTDAISNSINLPTGSKNGTHVHNNIPTTNANGVSYDGAIKMLSPGDLIGLITTIQTANNPTPENSFVVMISNECIFAITITGPIGVISPETRSFLRKWKESEYQIKAKNILEDYSTANARKEQMQKMFLKGLEDANLQDKVALFEEEVENETALDINNYNIKWTRKTLKKTFLGNTIQESPCN